MWRGWTNPRSVNLRKAQLPSQASVYTQIRSYRTMRHSYIVRPAHLSCLTRRLSNEAKVCARRGGGNMRLGVDSAAQEVEAACFRVLCQTRRKPDMAFSQILSSSISDACDLSNRCKV